MHDLDIAPTSNTPGIHTDCTAGLLQMQGDSYPENSFEFFQPLIAWLEDYLSDSSRPLQVRIGLAYLNTSSVRVMMDILDRLEEAFRQGQSIELVWQHENGNRRVAELAEEFREDCTFPYSVTPFGS